MNEINPSFAKVSQILPLIHALSVIFLISVQVCMVCIARIFAKEGGEWVEFRKILDYFKIYERFFILFFVCVCASGFFMANGSAFKFSDPMVKGVITTLWAGGGFIILNFIYMHYKIISLKRALAEQNEFEANEHLVIVVRYFIPLNIVISIICVYLGITLGEF